MHQQGVGAPMARHAGFPGMSRAIPAPLRAKGLLPLGTLLEAARRRAASFGIYALTAVVFQFGI